MLKQVHWIAEIYLKCLEMPQSMLAADPSNKDRHSALTYFYIGETYGAMLE